MWAENRETARSSSGDSSAPATVKSPRAYAAARQTGGACPTTLSRRHPRAYAVATTARTSRRRALSTASTITGSPERAVSAGHEAVSIPSAAPSWANLTPRSRRLNLTQQATTRISGARHAYLLRHRPDRPRDHEARAARRGDRQGRSVLDRPDAPRPRRGHRRSAVACQPAHLLGRSVRRHQLLQRQSHERRVQEPAHGRHQGG